MSGPIYSPGRKTKASIKSGKGSKVKKRKINEVEAKNSKIIGTYLVNHKKRKLLKNFLKKKIFFRIKGRKRNSRFHHIFTEAFLPF